MDRQTKQNGQEIQPHPRHQDLESFHPHDLTGNQERDAYWRVPERGTTLVFIPYNLSFEISKDYEFFFKDYFIHCIKNLLHIKPPSTSQLLRRVLDYKLWWYQWYLMANITSCLWCVITIKWIINDIFLMRTLKTMPRAMIEFLLRNIMII